MSSGDRRRRFVSKNGWWCAIVVGAAILAAAWPRAVSAGCECGKTWPHIICRGHTHGPSHAVGPGDIMNSDLGGDWYWVRSPEQERRVAMNTFNRLCIRCHGVDGRGVWDIPDVPDFTNHVWQATRPEEYRSRVILEGRGAVMPSFRGIVTLEESWALARYLRTLEPGREFSRPGLGPAAPAAPAAATIPPPSPAIPPPSTAHAPSPAVVAPPPAAASPPTMAPPTALPAAPAPIPATPPAQTPNTRGPFAR